MIEFMQTDQVQLASKDYYKRAVEFIESIGIKIQFRTVAADMCFVPGLQIEEGQIIVDQEKLKYPGDVLHEAGHIAVVSQMERESLSGQELGNRKDAPAEEMMAIAWSYAACLHLGIPPEFVFHENGYRGGGASIVENFRNGRYFGVPMLQWLKMAAAPGSQFPAYPAMLRWVRE